MDPAPPARSSLSRFRFTNMRHLVILVALTLAATWLAGCSTTPPKPGPADLRLSAPDNATEREYLGLTNATARFALEEIRCEVLVIDCFDMYCHICQTGAGHVNELYRLVQERGLGSRVKFLGLGLGDSPLEVATYKDKFQVPFPVFSDRRSIVAKQFGPVRLPNLLVLRKQADRLQVANSSPGLLLDPSAVLSHIQTALRQDQSYNWNDPAQANQPTCGSASGACKNASLPSRKVGGAKNLIAE